MTAFLALSADWEGKKQQVFGGGWRILVKSFYLN
jgi:hypothetical protein